jgi:hypothetical protein
MEETKRSLRFQTWKIVVGNLPEKGQYLASLESPTATLVKLQGLPTKIAEMKATKRSPVAVLEKATIGPLCIDTKCRTDAPANDLISPKHYSAPGGYH